MVSHKFTVAMLIFICTSFLYKKQIKQMQLFVPCKQTNVQEAVTGYERPLLWYVTGCGSNNLLSFSTKYSHYSVFLLDQNVMIDLSSQIGKRIRLSSFAIINLINHFKDRTSNLYKTDTDWFYPWKDKKTDYEYVQENLTNPALGDIRVEITIDPLMVQFKWVFIKPNNIPTFCARVVSDLSNFNNIAYYCCVEKLEENEYTPISICYIPWEHP